MAALDPQPKQPLLPRGGGGGANAHADAKYTDVALPISTAATGGSGATYAYSPNGTANGGYPSAVLGSPLTGGGRARMGSAQSSNGGGLGSLNADFTINEVKGHVTLAQAKWLFAAEVREDENRSCWRANWKALVLATLAVAGVIVCVTAFRAELSPHWRKILELGSIPVVSVVFTYCHIWLALWMTFYPLEFFGCYKPYIGWQGIVPAKAQVMAEKAVDLMTTRLINVQDVFGRLDPARVVQELEPALNHMLHEMMEAVALAQYPGFWESLPDAVKREAIRKAAADAPATIRAMMADIKANIATVFDLKHMVVDAFVSDKALLNYMFLKCGEKELNHIKVLGAYIGGLLGSIQMVIWIFYQCGVWLLPLTGFVAGYFTNWLAIKMIFEPVKPVTFCGITFQGLFLKRQMEVSAEYATLCTEHVLNAKYMLNALLRGPSSDALFELMFKHVRAGIDAYAGGGGRALLQLVVGGDAYQRTKAMACAHIRASAPKYLTYLERYTDSVMDVENLLFDKMSVLAPEEFEALLHPIFQEDEWKLIALGAFLGVVVGTLQVFLLQ